MNKEIVIISLIVLVAIYYYYSKPTLLSQGTQTEPENRFSLLSRIKEEHQAKIQQLEAYIEELKSPIFQQKLVRELNQTITFKDQTLQNLTTEFQQKEEKLNTELSALTNQLAQEKGKQRAKRISPPTN